MRWMNRRTIAFLFWIILVVVMIAVTPNIDKLVLEKGQVTIPETYQSEKGAGLLNEFNTNGVDTYQFVIVFHEEEGLANKDVQAIEKKLNEMVAATDELKILDSLLPMQSEQAAEQLVSEDGTTMIAQFSIKNKQQSAEQVATELREFLNDLEVETYVTGSDLVISDFTSSTQDGVKKTEVIAIVFILVILIIIFRSPVVPIVSLLTVGVSYIVSLAIITLLVEHANLPFSNFTQVFLIIILFGVGTDYNILLLSRFKEELVKQGHVLKAITETYKTAGKTVLYSGIAVLVGFIALFLAEFTIYQSTAAVSIGIAVLLLVLFTLNPLFMGVFGFKLFWPIKEIEGHKPNKIWAKFSALGFMRPLVSVLFIGVLTIPFIWSYSNELSYNDLLEVDDKYESKQAILLIEQHYDAGYSSPISLLIKSDDTLAKQAQLAEIDELTGIIQNVEGVAKVYSVTRPEGNRIEALYLNDQTNTISDGLGSAKDGVGEIHDGLSGAEEELSKPQDVSGVQQLIDGTTTLKNGATELTQVLGTLSDGVEQSTAGANDLAANLNDLHLSLGTLQEGLTNLASNYTTLNNGFQQFKQVFDVTVNAMNGSIQGYMQIETLMSQGIAANPQSEEMQAALAIAQQAQKDLAELTNGLASSKAQYEQLTSGLTQANVALNGAIKAVGQMRSGANELAVGAGQLGTGLQQAQNGSSQMANESVGLVTGLSKIQDGQTELQRNLENVQTQMDELRDGLKASTDGLDDIYTGLDDANRYLADLTINETGTFFIPQEVLEGEAFKESLDVYMNEDQTMSNLMIILEVNPYTEEAMNIVKEIDEKVQNYVASSSLAENDVYLAGKTVENIDLQSISKADFIRSAIVMLIGIMAVLLWVTRSMFQSILIIGALCLTNFAALGLTELFITNVLGHTVLSWNVPFFTLIMIITLGVDYSIFLMMRYNESKEQGLTEIMPAASEMGGVIIAAAVILGGTFAALIPSGIITLIQVAIAVMIGLFLLSFFVMPILLPACFGLMHKIQAKKKDKR